MQKHVPAEGRASARPRDQPALPSLFPLESDSQLLPMWQVKILRTHNRGERSGG